MLSSAITCIVSSLIIAILIYVAYKLGGMVCEVIFRYIGRD